MVHCVEQDSLSRRRSIYTLGKLPASSEKCVEEAVRVCLKNCPTAFNVQSARVVILLGEQQQKFWDMVNAALKKILPAEKFKASKTRIDAFAAAHGTILFYEDKKSLTELKKRFPLYKKNMPIWMQQGNGMLQYMIWQALSENDIGASLQHYTELVEKDVASWLPFTKKWQMVAQMPFGSIEQEAGEKEFLPLESRLKIIR
ncbi:MAG: nitroreductase family protein [Alphaproteobacteria bacterium]|nr:nitroreductase family protein [Alphaproteobacteria bacterium]